MAILLKSAVVAVFSVAATLLISYLLVPHLGGELSGAGLIMSIICPVAVAFPASAMHFSQAKKIGDAHRAASNALEQMRQAYKLLEIQERTDSLTGVLNRGACLRELNAASRRGETGALFFLDLDYFKQLNDQFGHALGDQALFLVGACLQTYADEGIVGRVGGEEFLVFLPEVDDDQVAAYANQLCGRIAAIALVSPQGQRLPISASIGATICTAHFDVEQALLLADGNMFKAKDGGRKRAVSC